MMATDRRVAVVTGANKGIGYAIVRGLCNQFKGDVYLTARREELGLQAVESLRKEGYSAKFHQLDVTKPDTIESFRAHLQDNYGGLDVLVNNAGIMHDGNASGVMADQAEGIVRTNFTGVMDVSEALFPLLRPHARVVNISSLISKISLTKCSGELQQNFLDRNITKNKLEDLMQQYVSCVKAGTHGNNGWPTANVTGGYGVSKIGVTVLSIIQQRDLLNDHRPDIVVNACCPGYVNTDLTFNTGTKTIEEGADTPLYLANLPAGVSSPKGEFVSDRKIVKWEVIKGRL